MRRSSPLSARLAALLLVALVGAGTATADVINFENYTGPSSFGDPAQTLTILGTSSGTVTISGGTILTNAVGALADETSIYATCSATTGCPAGYAQTITLTFAQPIENFFLDLYNGNSHPESFTSADNVGDSITQVIDSSYDAGTALVSFAAAGTQVTITTTDPNYNFAIDNVGFNQATPTTTVTPEPGTMALVVTGMAGLGGLWRRRRE